MKTVKFLSGGATLIALLLMFNSCEGFDFDGLLNGEDEEENVEGDGSGDVPGIGDVIPDPVAPSDELSPDQQKVKLEQAGLRLMEKCPADDFQKYFDLETAFEDEYASNEDYGFDALVRFGEDAYESSYDEDTKAGYDELKKEYLRTSVVNMCVTLSNHEGEFTFGPDSVYKHTGSNFDGVKVTLPLNGKTYVAELRSSENVTRAVYDYTDVYKDLSYGYYDKSTDQYVDTPTEIWHIYDDRYYFEIDVPETIDVVLYEDGARMADIEIMMTQSFSADGLNPAVDNFSAEVNVSLDNGYEIVVTQAAFDGAKQTCGGGVIFKKDGEVLVSAAGAGKAEIINTVYEREDEYIVSKYTTVKVKAAKDFTVATDILGEIQIKGTCSDGLAAAESMEAYYDAVSYYDENGNSKNPDEDEAKRHLSNLNAKFDLGVYYDLGTNRQAKVVLDMSKKYYDWEPGVVNYDIRPLIVFNDGSSYSLEEYFTEEAFKTLLDSFDSFSEDYETLVGDLGFAEELEPVPGNRPDIGTETAPEGTR